MAKLPANQTKLSKLEKAFISGMLATGGNLTQSLVTAGYTGKNPGAAASQIWRKPSVRAAFKEALWDKLGRGAGQAVNSLLELAQGAESEHARLAASNAILDRVGFKGQEEGKGTGGVHVTLNLNTSDLSATQPIDITPQPIEEQHAITATQSDDESY
jgi:hypothetical protein